VKGIEPSSSAWKAVALPLSYTRIGPYTFRASAAIGQECCLSSRAVCVKPPCRKDAKISLSPQIGRPDYFLTRAICVRSHSCFFGPSRPRPLPDSAGLTRPPDGIKFRHQSGRVPCSHSSPGQRGVASDGIELIDFLHRRGSPSCLASKPHRRPESCHGCAWPRSSKPAAGFYGVGALNRKCAWSCLTRASK
jgi:hypothetical protein